MRGKNFDYLNQDSFCVAFSSLWPCSPRAAPLRLLLAGAPPHPSSRSLRRGDLPLRSAAQCRLELFDPTRAACLRAPGPMRRVCHYVTALILKALLFLNLGSRIKILDLKNLRFLILDCGCCSILWHRVALLDALRGWVDRLDLTTSFLGHLLQSNSPRAPRSLFIACSGAVVPASALQCGSSPCQPPPGAPNTPTGSY